jgi:hypothetical protein
MDPIFLKDIHISLLLDPLALKFKQSCISSRPQNGQIEVLDSQILDSEILDLEKARGLKMILIQGSSSWMGFYIIKGYFIF